MKTILIALLRTEFYYLIKYDSIKTSSDRMIMHSFQGFKKLPIDARANLLQISLPLHEQEHEVLLIEYDNKLIGFDNAPKINTKGIYSIVPLTEMASKLLLSKINNNFNFKSHIELSVYKMFENIRGNIHRLEAADQLRLLFNLEKPKEDFSSKIKEATLTKIKNKNLDSNNSIFEHLLDFDITPSFCPEGNIEAFIKSACLGYKKIEEDIYNVKDGDIFKYLKINKEKIEEYSFYEATEFINENLNENELKDKYKTMQEILTENGTYQNAFFMFSYFYHLKKIMEINDYKIEFIEKDIMELKSNNKELASNVIFLLGYTLSIQTISRSLQTYSSSQLLKEKKQLNINHRKKAKSKEIILEITNQKEAIKNVSSKTTNISEKEKKEKLIQLKAEFPSSIDDVLAQIDKKDVTKTTLKKRITVNFLKEKGKQELEKMLGAKNKSEYGQLSSEFQRKWLYNIENPKENWTKEEYKALYYLMDKMANADKKFVEEEKDLIGKFHEELPMSSKINTDDFKVRIKPERAENIIKTMDNKKKEKVKEFLIKMGESDGKFIPSEKKYLERVEKIMLFKHSK